MNTHKRIAIFASGLALAVLILYAAQPKIGNEYAVTLPTATHAIGTTAVWDGLDWIDGTNGASGGGSIGASLTPGRIPVATGTTNIGDGPFAVTAVTNVSGAVVETIHRLNATNDVQINGVSVGTLTGDVTKTGASTTATIANNAVTLPKLVNATTTQRVMARNTAGAGNWEEVTILSILDWIGSTRGSVLYRGASGWAILAPGTVGTVLTSGGAGADPSYTSVSGTGDVTAASTFGTDNRVIRSDGTGKGVQGSSVTIDDSGNITTTGTVTSGSSGTGSVTIGSAGVILTDDGDGSLIITGNGNGSDEAVKFDFDNTANTLGISSSTGLNLWDFGTIKLAGGSYNKVTITPPATGSTLTIADGKTATINNSITQAGTDSTTMTYPPASDTVAGLAATQTFQNKKIQYSFPLAADDTFEGMFLTLTNTGGVTQWDAVYVNASTQLALADANGSGTYPCWGLATATASTGVATTIVLYGIVRNDGWSWTPGGSIYLSTTAGGLTQTAPSATGDKVQVIGKALNVTTILLRPSQDYGTAP